MDSSRPEKQKARKSVKVILWVLLKTRQYWLANRYCSTLQKHGYSVKVNGWHFRNEGFNEQQSEGEEEAGSGETEE